MLHRARAWSCLNLAAIKAFTVPWLSIMRGEIESKKSSRATESSGTPLSFMDFYKLSTHAHGLLTREQLDEQRSITHDQASASITNGMSWLTLEEASLIQRFYQAKISDVCTFLKLPKFVQVCLR